jgi:hypothetical protein
MSITLAIVCGIQILFIVSSNSLIERTSRCVYAAFFFCHGDTIRRPRRHGKREDNLR